MSANLKAYAELKAQLPAGTTLVAVSKFQPNEAIESLYAAGHRDFGENRVQELAAKAAVLPKDIRWHMIGRIQTNKIREFAPFVHLVHSVDRAIKIWSDYPIAFRVTAVGVNGKLGAISSPRQSVNVGQHGRLSEHVHVVAGTGPGAGQLMQHSVWRDNRLVLQ